MSGFGRHLEWHFAIHVILNRGEAKVKDLVFRLRVHLNSENENLRQRGALAQNDGNPAALFLRRLFTRGFLRGLELGWEVSQVDGVIVAKQHGAFNHVIQFTDVTRPVMSF